MYRDRWSHNMLIVHQYGFINVDFDLEISGTPAKEFEVAQAAYYALSGGKNKVSLYFRKCLLQRTGLILV